MKKLALVVVVFAVLVWSPIASARGNHRNAIDQKWRASQAQQKQQDDQFRAIQGDAAKEIKTLKAEPGPSRPVR